MMKTIRMAFFASLILFGAAISSRLGAETLEGEDIEDTEELDYDRCQGITDPICRTVKKQTCAEWYPCESFEWCCKKTITETRKFYFPASY
jgi:hypothetical protein